MSDSKTLQIDTSLSRRVQEAVLVKVKGWNYIRMMSENGIAESMVAKGREVAASFVYDWLQGGDLKKAQRFLSVQIQHWLYESDRIFGYLREEVENVPEWWKIEERVGAKKAGMLLAEQANASAVECWHLARILKQNRLLTEGVCPSCLENHDDSGRHVLHRVISDRMSARLLKAYLETSRQYRLCESTCNCKEFPCPK